MSRMFQFLFRGGDSTKFPNVEPAQNFRCGMRGFQERAVIFSSYMVAFFTLIGFSLVIWLRVANTIVQATVDFPAIDTFTVTCVGCKIQITNEQSWAGFFKPSNVIMYLPRTGEVIPLNFASGDAGFCSTSTRSCSIVMKNYEAFVPANPRRLFSDDQIDYFFYPFPTIDLIIPSDWKGRLVINSNNESSLLPHPTVVLPFKSLGIFSPLYPEVNPDISIPNLSLNSLSASYPIHFNGFRGGRYRNVDVNCVTGSFVARSSVFEPNSVVTVNIPLGDVIISANQQIETTVSDIYAATPPFVKSVSAASSSGSNLSITLNANNLRGAVNLIVPNGTCVLDNGSPFPGLGDSLADVKFTCDFGLGIRSSGPISGPVLLSYFGGNVMSTGYVLKFAASIGGASTSILSPSAVRDAKQRTSSGSGCSSQPPESSPGNVCVVAASSSAKVPAITSGNANDKVIMIPANKAAASGSFAFKSSAARSITLGSYKYSVGAPFSDYDKSIQTIAACPLKYEQKNDATSGRIASSNVNYNIPYEDQLNLEAAASALDSRNISFVVVKVKGSGANLPGYFTLTKQKIYTVIDPNIVLTLSFGLLPIPILALNVRVAVIHGVAFFACFHSPKVSLGVGLCPDLSESVSTRDGFGLGSATTREYVGFVFPLMYLSFFVF